MALISREAGIIALNDDINISRVEMKHLLSAVRLVKERKGPQLGILPSNPLKN